ncbi:MAG: GHKL domain-containing protein [Clostridia bacterium]|nr:GHKL domain-containing protein [Clostridia bacterium]
METFWMIIGLFFNLLQSLFCACFICETAKIDATRKQKRLPFIITTVILFTIITVVGFFDSFGAILNFACIAVPFIIACVFFSKNYLRNLLLSIIPFNAIAIGSIIATNVVAFVVEKSIVDFIDSQTTSQIMAMILGNVITIAILVIVARKIKKNKLELSKTELHAIAAVLFTSIVAFLFIYYVIRESADIKTNLLLSLVVLCLVAINIAAYALMIRISKGNRLKVENAIIKQQYEGQTQLVKEITAQYDNISKIRHDFKNTLGIVDSLIQSGKIQEASEYISDCSGSYQNNVLKINTHNDYLNAIVNYKCAKAREEDIEVSVCTISDVVFPDNIDLCNLLGNMFDNAIQAAKDCSSSRKIMLDINSEHSALNISMLNTVEKPVMIENPKLITTKKDKELHGFGTKIIRELAEKYNGSVDFYDTSDGQFCCSVILYPEKPV